MKVKASSLVELLVATVIICISFSSVFLVFLHYGNTSKTIRNHQIQKNLSALEKQISSDQEFPGNSSKYHEERIEINYSRPFRTDSIFIVDLIYSDSPSSPEIIKTFVYVKI